MILINTLDTMHYNIGYYALYVYVLRYCLNEVVLKDILFAYANVDAFIYF